MANLLLLPPKEALDRKDWLIEKVNDIKNPGEILEGMATIRRTHPGIYRLEFDYFESLYAMLYAKSKSVSNISFKDFFLSYFKIMGVIMVGGFILLLIVMAIIFYLAINFEK